MRKKDNAKILKQWLIQATDQGYPVKQFSNGGGYVALATACGATVSTKSEAKAFLRRKFVVVNVNRPRAKVVQFPKKPKRVISDRFYLCREWRELRYKVLVKYGRRCMCCGATPDDMIVLHVDHVIPISHRPDLRLTESNLQVLCADCNIGKSNLDDTDFRHIQDICRN